MTPEELAEEFEEADATAIQNAANALLITPDGKKFLWWLLKTSNAIGAQPYAAGDPHRTAFNCGTLEVGNAILALVTGTNPAAYLKFMMEQENDRSTRADAIRDAASSSTGSRPRRGNPAG
jgi:hypothetical protein